MDINVVVDTFGEVFPDVHEFFADLSRDWYADEPPGPYTVFSESIAFPIFVPMLEGSESPAELRKFFGCVEVLLSDSDRDLENLVKVEVLERLLSNDDWLRRAEPYMGPRAITLLEEFNLRRKWLGGALGSDGG